MSVPTPMRVYNGPVTLGEILDYGPAKILATAIMATGERIPLGFHPTRSAAMRAIEARHAGGPEPPAAA